MHCVPTTDKTDKTNDNNHPMNQFGPQSKNLASIIRGFKSAVTQKARQIHPDFAWQPRYYDHIIRNKQSFQKITTYIKNNPAKWKNDKFLR
jgi:REP element-mobilizing transposase RayT